jgi:hypothetical protein
MAIDNVNISEEDNSLFFQDAKQFIEEDDKRDEV